MRDTGCVIQGADGDKSSISVREGRKGPLFWVLLFLFVTLCAWWTVYFRYDSERLYRAIPPNAVFVSDHENFADRWDVVKRSAVAIAAARIAGVEQEEIDRAANDPVIAEWIERLASRKTVVGYVPALGRSGRPAWVLASWVGAYGQFLRWTALSSFVPNSSFKTIRFDGGRRAWVLEQGAGDESEWRLSLAIADGVLLACSSPDERGVCGLVEQMESSAPFVPVFGRMRRGFRDNDWNGSFTEKGWVRWPMRQGRDRKSLELAYGVSLDDVGGSSGKIVSDFMLPSAATLAESVDAGQLKNLLGSAPVVFCMVPFEYIEMLWAGGRPPQYAGIIRKGLESVTDSRHVFACMLGREYSGRMFGLKVPALAFGIRVENEDEALDMVVGLLDKLNARYGWGLIPQRMESGGEQVLVLDSAKKEIREKLGPHEKPALAVLDGWLVLCSNVEALAKLRDGAGGGAGGKWLEGLVGGYVADVSACVWADLDVSCRSLKDVLSVYSLVLMVSDSRGSGETREVLAEVMVWMELLRPLKVGLIEVASGDVGCEGYFRFGDAAEAAAATN